jgi:hypothetical protein
MSERRTLDYRQVSKTGLVFSSKFLCVHFVGFRQNQVSKIGSVSFVSVFVFIGFDLQNPFHQQSCF